MYKLEQQILKDGHRLRPKASYTKTSITVHSTGNANSTAQNERDWLDNPTNTRDASWHYVVGEGVVIQAIPDSETSWHSGTTSGNRTSIGVEIIESGNRKVVLETAAEFVADKCLEYGFDISHVKKHFDWSGKICPRILIDKNYIKDGLNWDWFIKRVGDNMSCNCEKEKVYNSLSELPEWAVATIKKLIDKKYLSGDEKGNLGLTETAIKVFVINDRAGLYGE